MINPYKEFFSYGRDNEGNHIYKNEVDFKRILEIIKIDENFSTIMYFEYPQSTGNDLREV